MYKIGYQISEIKTLQQILALKKKKRRAIIVNIDIKIKNIFDLIMEII